MSARSARQARAGRDDRRKDYDDMMGKKHGDSWNPKGFHRPGSLNPKRTPVKSPKRRK